MYLQQRTAYPAVSTAGLLGQVLGITGVGFLITALAAYLFQGMPAGFGLPALIAGLVLLFVMAGVRNNPAVALLVFYAFTFLEGIGLAPVIAAYVAAIGPDVVVNAAATTGLGMLVLGAVAFVFSGFPAVDMVPLNSAFTAIPPFNGARFGYFVTLQDLNEGSIQVAPGYHINTGDTLAASAALPCKYIMMSNPATISVIVGFGGISIPTDDSAIPSIVTNLQQAIPGCVPVQ